jgi:hypothetical protein
MLKYSIDKASFDGLDSINKSHYTQDGDNYRLEVDGLEDVGALKRAKDHEASARKSLAAELATARDRLAKIEQIDVEAVKKETTAEVAGKFLSKLIDIEALRIAQKLAGSDGAELAPYIKGRLSGEQVDGDWKIVAKNTKGEILKDLADLEADFLSNKVFSGIISNKPKGMSGGQTLVGQAVPVKQLSKMTPYELAERYKSTRR